MLRSDVRRDEEPFAVGRVDDRGYVHVFDDTTLDVILQTLDTITDFTRYLTRKEAFLDRQRVWAAGEEELLCVYLGKVNDAGEHDFVLPGDFEVVMLAEGGWAEFEESEQRQAQVEADRVSYFWDTLIEKFIHHLLTGTQYKPTSSRVDELEVIFRFMAREPRTRRRMLAKLLLDLVWTNGENERKARIVGPSNAGDPYYVFLAMPRVSGMNEDEYREFRRSTLGAYCHVLRLEHPDARDVVGIATEGGRAAQRTEDALYADFRDWSVDDEYEARRLQRDLDMFTHMKPFAGNEREYPERANAREHVSRNSRCPCGSGRRVKRCCGR